MTIHAICMSVAGDGWNDGYSMISAITLTA